MLGSALATDIRVAMSFPEPNSTEMLGWGNAVVQHVQSGLVNNASGTITGTCPPSGGPLSSGAATNGLISGLSGSTLASLVVSEAGYPSVSAQVTAFCTEIVNHIQTQGTVSFSTGNITGNCTNTAVNPGTFTGEGSNGTISGLNGSTLASAIHGSAGYPGSVSPELILFCTAIVDYIMANAVVAYAMGSCTGSAPAGGGALIAGTGVNGTIT